MAGAAGTAHCKSTSWLLIVPTICEPRLFNTWCPATRSLGCLLVFWSGGLPANFMLDLISAHHAACASCATNNLQSSLITLYETAQCFGQRPNQFLLERLARMAIGSNCCCLHASIFPKRRSLDHRDRGLLQSKEPYPYLTTRA